MVTSLTDRTQKAVAESALRDLAPKKLHSHSTRKYIHTGGTKPSLQHFALAYDGGKKVVVENTQLDMTARHYFYASPSLRVNTVTKPYVELREQHGRPYTA